MKTYMVLMFLLGSIHCTRLFNVILFGATGDLARKYLWNGFFNLFQTRSDADTTFHFFACGRTEFERGSAILNSILTERIKCNNDDDCKTKRHFIQQITYVQMKNEEQYERFGQILKTRSSDIREEGRVFYLSIPTSVYAVTVSKLHKYCLPKDAAAPWIRLVLEKPFGRDLGTAETLSKEILKYFHDDQIYRIDHYLGKSVVKQILPFRLANRNWLEEYLSHEYVDHIEIAVKEKVDIKGRASLYDETGVVRDVFQNHLTELMILLAMDLPQNLTYTEEIFKNKLRVLKQCERKFRKRILLGQYSDYLKDVTEESVKSEFSAYVPTFAVASVYINSPRWKGVPFLLLSGKKLEQRRSYIKIIFKDNFHTINQNASKTSARRQIVFHIGHGNVKTPYILVTKRLPNVTWPDTMVQVQSENVCNNLNVYGVQCGDFHIAFPEADTDAYVSLINDVFLGLKQNFVSTEQMLLQWRLWDPVLEMTRMDLPRLYSAQSQSVLDFIIKNRELSYVANEVMSEHNFSNALRASVDFIPATLPNSSILVHNSQELAKELAMTIKEGIETADKLKQYYHLALPGGRSPQALFYLLAQKYTHLPWHRVIVWFIDERCVPSNHIDSNQNMIQSNLLQFIDIPTTNIIGMPVFYEYRLCDPEDNRSNFYHKIINDKLNRHNKSGFDMIVLGLGADAHIASIFPYSKLLHSGASSEYVAVIEDESTAISKRMTLTLSIINKAQNIAILVTGKEKHTIVTELSDNQFSDMQYPVTFIHPRSGHMRWYIDYDAWFG